MRYGLAICGSLDIMTGGFLYDRMMTDYLRSHGDEVEIISIPWRGYAWSFTDNFSRSLRRRLRGGTWTVLLQDELAHPSLFLLNRRLDRKNGRRVVSIVHHLRSSEQRPAAWNWLYRRIERAYLNSCDGFIFNSRATRMVVERTVGAAKPCVVAHPAGDRLNGRIGEDDIRERCYRDGPLELVFVGSVIRRKNLHTLLQALSAVTEEVWRLTIVGDDAVDREYTSRIRRRIKACALNDRIEFTGRVSDRALASRLARSHVMAVPSSYEGFGVVYLEGMSFGLPALASVAGGAAEVVDHGRNGFLASPDDAETLAGYIGALARDRDLLCAMSLAAYDAFRRRPTWEESAANIHDFLRGLTWQ